MHGSRVAVNADFARQAIFLSEQLDCSERYAAEILQTITAQNPNADSKQTLELSVAEYHSRRRMLVDCISFLTEVAIANQVQSGIHQHLKQWFQQEIINTTASYTSASWVSNLLQMMDALGGVIRQADNAQRGASSNTVAPTGQGEYSIASMSAFQ
jgi:nuclear pore complex protein Nup205